MGRKKNSAIALAPAATAPAAAELPASHAIVDRWISLRAERALTPVGYTPVADLYVDFQAWHEAEYPADHVPTEAAFSMSLRSGWKIRFENLPVRVPFEKERVSLCANLTLRNALRSAA